MSRGLRLVLILTVLGFLGMVPVVVLISRRLEPLVSRPSDATSQRRPPAPVRSSPHEPTVRPGALAGNDRIYLVPVGKVASVSLTGLVDYYRQQLGITLHILPEVPLDGSAEDAQRRQMIAEELIGRIQAANPSLADDPEAILIGVTDHDMYIWSYDWSFAFNLRREGRRAILSTARMNPQFHGEPADSALLEARVRKALTKNLGILYYGMELSRDPRSVLYRSILSIDDLDQVREGFTQQEVDLASAVLKARQQSGERLLLEDEADPCWTVAQGNLQTNPGRKWQGFTGCMEGPAENTETEAYYVDLRLGLFILRRNDFNLPDKAIPILLTRTYRNADEASRPFGVGGNHPYGIFLWSANELREADLVLEHGGRVHYRRTTPPVLVWPVLYEEESSVDGGLYDGSRIEEKWPWRGWELKLADGTVYTFGDQAPLESIRRYGRQLTLERPGGKRNPIARIRSPFGQWIEFQYDLGGRITRAQDRLGRRMSYTYDPKGRLVEARGDGGWHMRYSYDARSNLLEVADAQGGTVLTNQYDTQGRVIRQTLSDGRTYEFRYAVGAGGGAIRTDVVLPSGRVVTAHFDPASDSGSYRVTTH